MPLSNVAKAQIVTDMHENMLDEWEEFEGLRDEYVGCLDSYKHYRYLLRVQKENPTHFNALFVKACNILDHSETAEVEAEQWAIIDKKYFDEAKIIEEYGNV